MTGFWFSGCNECVTVCEAGGKKEVEILASALRMYFVQQGQEKKSDESTPWSASATMNTWKRSVRTSWITTMLVLSLACGVGVQFMAEKYHTMPLLPGVNTCLSGGQRRKGGSGRNAARPAVPVYWPETGGICPVSRCAKRVMNGPCGGSSGGKCEINKDVDCAWQLIIDRLRDLGRLEDYEKVTPIKDWSTERAGGPRTVTREDVQV